MNKYSNQPTALSFRAWPHVGPFSMAPSPLLSLCTPWMFACTHPTLPCSVSGRTGVKTHSVALEAAHASSENQSLISQ